MKASDVMTRGVVCIGPEATVLEAARMLLGERVSALPVVDADGRILGIVSEADLIRREEIGSAKRRSWWSAALTDGDHLASDYIKAHGRLVRDVMTKDVATASEDTPLGEIAEAMDKRRVKRLPITRDGRIVGIVSRANLLQALIAGVRKVPIAAVDDAALRREVNALLARQSWSHASVKNVIVRDGVAELWGYADSPEQAEACRIAIESVPGIKRVESHLAVQAHGIYLL